MTPRYIRRDGPPTAQKYTFPALVTTDRKIEREPESVKAAIRAVMKAHKALREDINLATEVGRRRFPPDEAELIAGLIKRDLPFYTPEISREVVEGMNGFAQQVGLLSGLVPYERVVATRFSSLWKEIV